MQINMILWIIWMLASIVNMGLDLHTKNYRSFVGFFTCAIALVILILTDTGIK